MYSTNSSSASLVTVVRIVHIRVHVPRVAVATIRRQGLVEETQYHHHYGICKTWLLQLLLSTKNLTSEFFAFLFDPKIFLRLNPLQRMT